MNDNTPPLPPVRVPPNPSFVMRIGRAIYEWLSGRNGPRR